MIVVVPASRPVTTPELLPTVAVVALLLLHVPPVGVLLSVLLLPTHTVGVPPITAGRALTVTLADTPQFVGSV